MTPPGSRRATLRRWLLALLLLATLAWGVGEMRSDRGPKPELGVGDLRQTERPAGVEQAARERPGAEARPGSEARSGETGGSRQDGAAVADPGASAADR